MMLNFFEIIFTSIVLIGTISVSLATESNSELIDVIMAKVNGELKKQLNDFKRRIETDLIDAKVDRKFQAVLPNISVAIKDIEVKVEQLQFANVKPPEWKLSPHGTWVRYFHEKKNWIDAYGYCQSLGTDVHLVTVLSMKQNDWLKKQMMIEYAWIGANDRGTEGLFKWANNQTLTFKNWGSGQPDNFGGDQQCVCFYGRRATWGDEFCDFETHFFCEQFL